MLRRSRRSSLPLLALLVSLAAPALADREAAKELFRSGRAAFERGDYIAAAHGFEQAYAQDPTGESLYNAALSWHAAGRLARAADRYERAIAAGGLDPSLERDAQRLLAELEPKLGVVVVQAPEGTVSLPGLDAIAVPARVRVEPGTHAVRLLRKDGTESVQSATVAAGGTVVVDFPQPAREVARRDSPPRQRSEPTRDRAPEPSHTQQILGWSAIGVSAVAAGAAIYLGTQAVDARDEWVDSDLEKLDAHDRAVTLRTWTNVAWGGSLVFGVTGVILLFTADSDPPVAVSLHPSGAGASYRARF